MKKVIIDPGHGGSDKGAVAFGHYEKIRNLVIAKEIAKQLTAQGVETILTRDDDSFMLLKDRTNLENKIKPDCFISCHMDAAGESACGMTVWVHSKADNVIMNWANDMIAELKKVGYTNNRYQSVNKGYVGNPSQDYAINRDTIKPSMLIEYGFITNQNNLNEHIDRYKDYAKATVKSICKFIGVTYKEINETVPREEYESVCALLQNCQIKLNEAQARAINAENKITKALAILTEK